MNKHLGWTIAWDQESGRWFATKGTTKFSNYADVLELKKHIDTWEHNRQEKGND